MHLPYSSEFESVCRKINPAATTEDKHRIWEELLDRSEVDTSPTETIVPSQVTPGIPLRSETSVIPAPPSPRISRAPRRERFALRYSRSHFRPSTLDGSPEPDLSPELAERRQKMLAEIANSYLATREQRIAHVLQKFPETRDSDTALCIRYWKMFQADVLERWRPL